MIRPLPERLSALIVANFAAAAALGLTAIMIAAIYIVITPADLSNGAAAIVGGAVFVGVAAAIAGTVIGFVFFLVGLITVGIPTWWVLHRIGSTSGFAFAAVGAVESVLGGTLVRPLLLPLYPFAIVLVLVLPGAVAGWVIWRLGYDQTLTPPQPPPPAPPS